MRRVHRHAIAGTLVSAVAAVTVLVTTGPLTSTSADSIPIVAAPATRSTPAAEKSAAVQVERRARVNRDTSRPSVREVAAATQRREAALAEQGTAITRAEKKAEAAAKAARAKAEAAARAKAEAAARAKAEAAARATAEAAARRAQAAAQRRQARATAQAEATAAQARSADAARTKAAADRATTSGYGTGSTDPRDIARQMMSSKYGWGADQFTCLDNIIMRESGWQIDATNPSSGAYGIPQALPGTKMATAGADWRTNPATQISWALGYLHDRYGTPCGGWAFKSSHGWY